MPFIADGDVVEFRFNVWQLIRPRGAIGRGIGVMVEETTPQVVLSGHLICASDDEVAIVQRHLPLHIDLTRDEPGCISFEVHPTADRCVWQVDERFVDDAAFDAHQARVAGSEWGRVSAGIERRYSIRRTER